MRNRADLMLGLLGVFAAIESTSNLERGRRFIETPNRDSEIAKEKHLNVLKHRDGVKQFIIDGKVVFARNYKNALRKAKKFDFMKVDKQKSHD